MNPPKNNANLFMFRRMIVVAWRADRQASAFDRQPWWRSHWDNARTQKDNADFRKAFKNTSFFGNPNDTQKNVPNPRESGDVESHRRGFGPTGVGTPGTAPFKILDRSANHRFGMGGIP